MFNVCPGCGEYSVENLIDPVGPFAVCGGCGHRHRFLRLPLFLVTGASGAGKTAVALALPALLPECIVLETDVLWGTVPATGDDGLRSYWEAWLRLVKNLHQGGRPVVLCGTVLPEHLEACVERRYIGAIHCLALVCAEEQLRASLLARLARAGVDRPDARLQSLADAARRRARLLDRTARYGWPRAIRDRGRGGAVGAAQPATG